MLRVYRQARLATMTIIGRTETVSDELPGDSHAAPEAVEITTAQRTLGRLSPTGLGWGVARGGGKRWVLVCLSFPEMCCCGVYGSRGTTSLHNRCYLFAFFRLAKASTKCVGREARYMRSAPSPFARVWRSTPAQPRLKNAKKITPVLQAKELNSEIRYRVQRLCLEWDLKNGAFG